MFKKFLIVLGLVFIANNNASADIRFIQVAESSVSTSNATQLKQCVRDINTIKDVDFVVFTGDNILNAKKENLRTFLKTIRWINAPVIIAINIEFHL